MQKMENSHDKWSQPGWRIEQKYSNKVLIGNWVEEKLQVGIFFITLSCCVGILN